MIHNFLRFIYAKNFPELETLVTDTIAFAKTVQRLESCQNKNEVSLEDILSNHLVVAIKIALSQIKTQDLSVSDRANALKSVEFLLFMNEEKHKVRKVLT